jgi:hypothetical protein
VILTLALRSLFAHPVRSAVLAAGFGLGVAVMAILLGVGRVVLEQARAPELNGGGDVLVTGHAGAVTSARVLLSGALNAAPLQQWTRAASPWSRATVYLIDDRGSLPVRARGGIPSLEQALGDPEIDGQPWRDTAADARWTSASTADLLRSVDRFHAIPDLPEHAASWAEWLYFNGRAADARFYLTFMVGPRERPGRESRRVGGVRLQLDRGGEVESFGASQLLTDQELARAPELTIANNQVRLNDAGYQLSLDLRSARGTRVTGTLTIDAAAQQLMPPIEIFGARGWRTGYVVPVISGALGGTLHVDGTPVTFDSGIGYHDHNWGFWRGVSWQWGQVHQGGTSFVYGRVFPPADVADPERMPGFLGAIGPDGPIGFATNVTIEETNDTAGRPARIVIRGRNAALDLTLTFSVQDVVVNQMQGGGPATGLDFLQMRGTYDVRGRVADRDVSFTASGAAETFRGSRRATSSSSDSSSR